MLSATGMSRNAVKTTSSDSEHGEEGKSGGKNESIYEQQPKPSYPCGLSSFYLNLGANEY
jgi:hypothetical protein